MKKDPSAFVNQLMVCLLVTICIGGSIGFGTVWMRHQISVTARGNRELAAQLARFDRLNDETRTLIETEQAPDRLRHLNTAMRLGLVPMSDIPVLHVTENVVERLARRANRELFLEPGAAAPRITFQVAQR